MSEDRLEPDRPALRPLRRRRPARRLARRGDQRGKIVHVGMRGQRDAEAGLPVAPDTLCDLLDDQADHLGGRDDAGRGGAVELTDPISRSSRSSARPGSTSRGPRSSRSPCPRPSRSAFGTCSRTRPADLRLPPRAPGRRDLPAAGYEWGVPRGTDLATAALPGRLPAWCSSPARSGLLGVQRCAAAGGRVSPASRSTSSSRTHSSARSA